MFSENVQMVDIDPEHWVNLIKLLQGGRALDREDGEKGKGEKAGPPARATLLVKHDRCLKANLGPGRDERPEFSPQELADPAALASRHGFSRVTIVEQGAPRRIMHRIQSSLSLDMNYLEQALLIYSAIREEMGRGIKIHPRLKLPEVKPIAITTALRALVPAGELVAIVIYSEDGQTRDSSGLPVVTGWLLRWNHKQELDLVTTTDSLVPAGLKIEDWRRDYRKVNELAEKVWASKVFLGAHIPLAALVPLARSARKKAFPKTLQELAKQEKLILDPYPFRLKMLLKMGWMLKV